MMRGMRYGSFEVVIHDCRVVQIIRAEKLRIGDVVTTCQTHARHVLTAETRTDRTAEGGAHEQDHVQAPHRS